MSDVLDANSFEVNLKQWMTLGNEVVKRLDDIINEMKHLSVSHAKYRMFGKIVGIAGGVIAIGGILISPLTGGASIAVGTLVGTGVSSIGQIAYHAADINEKLKENSKSDEIAQVMKGFSDKTDRILADFNTSSRKSDQMLAASACENVFPLAVQTVQTFSKLFEIINTKQSCEDSTECKRESAVVDIIVLIVPIASAISALIDEKRIVDGKVFGNYIEKLCNLRTEFNQCLTAARKTGYAHQECE